MRAPRLDTKIDLSSEECRARAAHNRALAEKLRKDVARAARAGTRSPASVTGARQLLEDVSSGCSIPDALPGDRPARRL
jgi:hypothetical protein